MGSPHRAGQTHTLYTRVYVHAQTHTQKKNTWNTFLHRGNSDYRTCPNIGNRKWFLFLWLWIYIAHVFPVSLALIVLSMFRLFDLRASASAELKQKEALFSPGRCSLSNIGQYKDNCGNSTPQNKNSPTDGNAQKVKKKRIWGNATAHR